MKLPEIIQGGMGIAVSNWRLARSVSGKGQLGVISGTAIDSVHARILQDGDAGGHLRSAYAKFPQSEIAQRVLARWYSAAGRSATTPYRPIPIFNDQPNRSLEELTVLSCFGEIELARNGKHGAAVGINLLDKIRIPQLASLYGSMLAGVDYVLMGAGIPLHVPGILDRFAEGLPATLKFPVEGGGEGEITFDPSAFLGHPAPKLKRPKFLAIITSDVLAKHFVSKASGRVDGFVVEMAIAGGHNAPPRGKWRESLGETGEPVYGPKDAPDFTKMAAIGLPFWIGGGYAGSSSLADAKAVGATGVQIGTAFACCEESGMATALKRKLIALAKSHVARVFTDPFASPTGFPFKVARVPGTVSEPDVYAARQRVCDMGYLRSAYRREDGGIGFRCASEPEENYVRKGGDAADTTKRVCLCNSLMAACGFPQVRKRAAADVAAGDVAVLGDTLGSKEFTVEAAVSTVGDTLGDLVKYLKNGADTYSAADVLSAVLMPVEAACPVEAALNAAVAAASEAVSTFVADITEVTSKTVGNIGKMAACVGVAASAASAKARENMAGSVAKARETVTRMANDASEVAANARENFCKVAANVSDSVSDAVANVTDALRPPSASGSAC
ncbi:MAG: hypothetical protein LBT53_09410 [Puniceicoccales bacterium]|jgi:nitronate monooxygenase|nr:hypothetical protein [Puniceicoccales bacterium]